MIQPSDGTLEVYVGYLVLVTKRRDTDLESILYGHHRRDEMLSILRTLNIVQHEGGKGGGGIYCFACSITPYLFNEAIFICI